MAPHKRMNGKTSEIDLNSFFCQSQCFQIIQETC